VGVERRIEHFLQVGARLLDPALVDQDLGQEEMRHRRSTSLRALDRPIRFEIRIEPRDGFQFFLRVDLARWSSDSRDGRQIRAIGVQIVGRLSDSDERGNGDIE
jgi:hypothetical protein